MFSNLLIALILLYKDVMLSSNSMKNQSFFFVNWKSLNFNMRRNMLFF